MDRLLWIGNLKEPKTMSTVTSFVGRVTDGYEHQFFLFVVHLKTNGEGHKTHK